MMQQPLGLEVIHHIQFNPVMLRFTFLPFSSNFHTTFFTTRHNESIVIVYTKSLPDFTDCAMSFEETGVYLYRLKENVL